MRPEYKYHLAMRRIILSSFLLIICCNLFCQDLTTEERTVYIGQDTTIVVRELLKESHILYNGYSGKNSKGQWFNSFRGCDTQEEALKGIRELQTDHKVDTLITINESNDIVLTIHYPCEDLIFTFDQTGNSRVNSEWQTVVKHIITIKCKSTHPDLSNVAEIPDSTHTKGVIQSLEGAGDEARINSGALINYIILGILLILLVTYACLMIRNKRVTSELKKQISEMSERLNNIKIPTMTQNAPTLSKEKVLGLISVKDLEPIITEGVQEVLRSPNVAQSINTVINDIIDSKQLSINKQILPPDTGFTPRPEIKPSFYDNVVYDSETNTFRIIDNVSVKIFIIIEKNGDYFFTLVDDPAIRREFFSILGNYKKCINVIQESSYPSIADVAEEGYGHLFKDGNIFRVDPAKLLNIVLR